MLTLLGIPGALRAASTNRLLLAEARRAFGKATQTEANLRLPLYDGDLEEAQGIPPEVQALADQIAEGRAGGVRSQFALRLALTPFRPRLLSGPEVLVADSSHAFTPEGRLIDPRYQKALAELMGALRAEAERAG